MNDLCLKNVISTCSVVYRADVVSTIGPWWLESGNGDWALHLMHAQHGRIHNFTEIMARYRVHAGGIWSSLPVVKRLDRTLNTFWLMRKNLFHDQASRLDLGIFLHWGYLIVCLTLQGQFGRALVESWRLLMNREVRRYTLPLAIAGLSLIGLIAWAIASFFR